MNLYLAKQQFYYVFGNTFFVVFFFENYVSNLFLILYTKVNFNEIEYTCFKS